MGAIYTVFGIISLLSGIISTLLNPISFYYHFIKGSTTSARLYCLLAAADFASNIIFPFFLSYCFLSDRPEEDSVYRTRSISTTERVMSAFLNSPGYISGFIVSTIAILRFIAVKSLFCIVRNKSLFFYRLAVFLFYSAASLLQTFSGDLSWCQWNEHAFPNNSSASTYSIKLANISEIGVSLYMVAFVIGSITSIGTIILVVIRKIRRNSLTHNAAAPNSTDIIRDGIPISSMIVFANVITLTFQIISIIRNEGCGSYTSFSIVISIFTYSVCPIISCALDPLIIIIFSGEIKNFVKEKIFGK